MSHAKRWTIGIALALFESAYWLNLYAWFIEPNRLVVREANIASRNWTGAPLRIALVGDTHVAGPHVSAERMASIVARVNAQNPDIILLLGDYVAGHVPREHRAAAENAEIERGLSAFAELRAPLGVVAILGNHDAWYDNVEVTRLLDQAGVRVLENDYADIARGADGAVTIAGLEDADTGAPDFRAALQGLAATDAIIISHSPDPFANLPPDLANRVAITFAAHTHCGQVSLPFLGRPITPSRYGQRYACGRIEENGSLLYVTGGIGTSVLPLRFLNPPEIVMITLHAPTPLYLESAPAGVSLRRRRRTGVRHPSGTPSPWESAPPRPHH